MACGVPVISTKCGGPEAYVQSGLNGHLCDFDASEIAAHATGLLKKENRYLDFSKVARNSVGQEYTMCLFERNFCKHWSSIWGVEI
jgi:glycosyltransferase involved in cell wall biosynthesis